MDADDLNYYFEERSAVYEFDGKLTRSEAEKRAKEETDKLKKQQEKE